MAGATKTDMLDRPPGAPPVMFRLRRMNMAWASITLGSIRNGELVHNEADNSLVYRKNGSIYRYDSDATRVP